MTNDDILVINGILIVLIATATLVIGIYSRQARSKTNQLEERLANRKELFTHEFASKEDTARIAERLARVEIAMRILHPGLGNVQEEDRRENE